MLKTRNVRMCGLAFALLAQVCFAQNPDSAKFYKLDFTLKEVEGAKVLNARSYSMTASTDTSGPPSSIRAGNKVPVTAANGSTNFIEVGVNIDCRSVREAQNELFLIVSAEMTSTPQETATPAYPLIRQNKWNSSVIVPIKRPTVIFSSDDIGTRRQIQVELTATPIR